MARTVTGVPQYHDNHILLAPLAFNLLMGRHWPPIPEDLAAAETCCRDLGLGLGPTLDRMPAGLQQIVGETGWQLSQGERSLVYIARALLAGPSCSSLTRASDRWTPPPPARHCAPCSHAPGP